MNPSPGVDGNQPPEDVQPRGAAKPLAMSCTEKAVDLLSRQPHFVRQLEAKLLRRGYRAEEVAATLARMIELNYLDDRRTARGFVEARLRRGGEGVRRLRAALVRKGASAEAVDEALELVPRDDLELARQTAAAWRRSRRRKLDPNALARHLDRKGFSRRSIFALIDELRDEVRAEAHEDEGPSL